METIDITRGYFAQATPGVGFITIDDDYHIGDHQAEVRAALFLHNAFGGDIKLLKEETSVTGIKMPDYEWHGKLWELKGVATQKATEHALRYALKQIFNDSGGVILKYADKSIKAEELREIVTSRFMRSKLINVDIIILIDNQATIWRYKK